MAQYGTVYGGYDTTTGVSSFRVKSSYKPRAEKIKRVLRALSNLELTVGWDNKKDATKAFLQEFGFTTGEDSMIPNKKVPARPFIRPAIEGAKGQIANRLKEAYNEALKNGSSVALKDEMESVGDFIVAKIRKGIERPKSPLKPITKATKDIRKKRGSRHRSKPLMDTDSMYNNITSEVKRKRG